MSAEAEFCTPDETRAWPADAAAVKLWLQATGRSQKALAAEIAVQPSIVCQWLRGKLSHRKQRSVAETIAALMAAEGALSPVSAAASAAWAAPPRKLARTTPPPHALPLPHIRPPPQQHHAAPSTPAARAGGGSCSCGYVDDGEVTIVREVSSGAKSILQSAPHGRDQCEIEPLWRCAEQPTRCCALCYCVLCDAPVASCPAWAAHCMATFRGPTAPQWRALRRELAEAQGTAKRKQSSILDWLGGGRRGGAPAAGQPRADLSAAVAAAPSRAEAEAEDVKPAGGIVQWMQVRLCVLAEGASDELVGLEVATRPDVLGGSAHP